MNPQAVLEHHAAKINQTVIKNGETTILKLRENEMVSARINNLALPNSEQKIIIEHVNLNTGHAATETLDSNYDLAEWLEENQAN